MNGYELTFLVLGEILIFAYFWRAFRSAPFAAVLTLLVAVPLYLSLAKATQFLTIDETYIVKEAISLPSSDMFQWQQGALRTTDVLVGSYATLFALSGRFSAEQLSMLAKAFHWLLGIATLLWLHNLVDRYFVDRQDRRLFAALFLCISLLLPTNILALKVFNYDLLSMLLGIIALIYIYGALVEGKTRLAVISMIVATLAAQEKLLASPALVLSIAVYAYLRHRSAASRPVGVGLAVSVVAGAAISACVGSASWLTVAALRGWDLTGFAPSGALDQLLAWTQPLMQFTLGHQPGEQSVAAARAMFLTRLGVTLLATYAIAFVGTRWSGRIKAGAAKATDVVVPGGAALALVAVVVGALGILRLPVYGAPYAPIPPGNYHPLGQFNDTTLHFGARTLPEHLGSFVVYAYAALTNALPTAIWITLLLVLAASWLLPGRRPGLGGRDLALYLGLGGALLAPLAFGLGQVPVSGRYLNLFVYVVVLVSVVKAARLAAHFSALTQVTCGVALGALLLWEILPFGPIYAPFRPFWANYGKFNSVTPVAGQFAGPWPGWGEEAMLAGEEIARRCAGAEAKAAGGLPPDCQGVTLHVAYPGLWLGAPEPIAVQWMEAADDLTYTADDYYVLNRSSVAQQYWVFPAAAKPDFVLSYRGFVQAWVFRGDRLREAGFHFEGTRTRPLMAS